MKPIVGKNLKSTVVKGGQNNAARVGGAGGAKKKVETQKTPAVKQPTAQQTGPLADEFGVTHNEKPDGSVSLKAKSGMGVDISSEGDRTVSLGNGEASFKMKDGGIELLSGSAKDFKVSNDNEAGSDIVSFKDKSGDLVQVEPDSMTYSVTRNSHSAAGVTQVFYPDGKQEVTAFGYGGGKPYEKSAFFDEKGAMIDQQGFGQVQVGAQEIGFDAAGTGVKRSLPRPLPGQEAVAAQEPKEQAKPPAERSNAAPTALLAEGPSLLALPAGVTPGILSAQTPPAPEPKVEAAATPTETPKAEAKGAGKASPFPDMPKFESGFFDMKNGSETIGMNETKSGVTVREEGATRSFKLPNGDMFRTDGNEVEVLGDKPRAKNAKMVEEDGQQLLAYRDGNRNSYQLNVNTGDLTMSNSNGSMKQKLNADGSQEFEARSTHTTEAMGKEHSFHKAKFGADGTLVEKSGFDNLEVDAKSLVYTLPNGEVSVKNLVDPTTVRYNEPKPDAPGVEQGWGDAQGAVDSILGTKSKGPAAAVGATNPTDQTAATEGPSEAKFEAPKFARNGMTRTTLPDGSVLTRLPSGISINDNPEKPFATDANGNKLEVLKREVPTESGYILYTKSKEGVGYTIAPDHLDMLAESKDGKVHQIAFESGMVESHVKDGKNLHSHRFDPNNQFNTFGSPGVGMTPDRLYVDSPDNRSYELPHPLPGASGGGGAHYGQGPGQQGPRVQPGYKPSFWQRLKGAFTGDNPWQPTGPQGPGGPGAHHGTPSYGGGMPSSHHQYDPMSGQMHEMQQMQRMTSMMSTMSMVGVGLSSLSLLAMPTMFYGGW
jgi:hypothetical protein